MQPKIHFVDEHDIDPVLIDLDALFVLDKLRNAGFTAYLVGGSVRDLLIKKTPKDFDISTSARPEQIKQLFQRQCILIGRRFRLAHIRFGHKILEVSTFRTGETDSNSLITQDNEWGTPAEDVLRRDFTINGLFYDPSNHSIIDYVDGWDDIHQGILRTIGDPEIRFKQDPVRLLRLIKFQARYDFVIHFLTQQAIKTCCQELLKSSSARVLEEILKMLESGASAAFFRLLAEYQILPILMPQFMQAFCTSQGKKVLHYLACIDQLYQHKKKNTLDRSVLAACLIFPLLEYEIDKYYSKQKQFPHIGEITLLASTLIKEFWINAYVHFPRRLSSMIMSILVAQYRITPLTGKKHYREKLLRHKDFEIALLFFKLRAMVEEKWVDTYCSIKNQYHQLVQQGHRKPPHPNPQQRHFYKYKKNPDKHVSSS